MITIDAPILAFIKENPLTCWFAYAILREIIAATPWKFDDRIKNRWEKRQVIEDGATKEEPRPEPG